MNKDKRKCPQVILAHGHAKVGVGQIWPARKNRITLPEKLLPPSRQKWLVPWIKRQTQDKME